KRKQNMAQRANVTIDLSHHNSHVDLVAAKAAGVQAVIHKATQGTKFVDPEYNQRHQSARELGVLWGAYHFGTGADGVSQAEHFLEVAQPTGIDLIILDFEANVGGPSMSLEEARAFITHIQNSLGRFPGFYSGHYVKELLGTAKDPIL